MVQLQHKRRREGGVTVESTRYELDSRGVVTVSAEHAALMLQGASWRPVDGSGELPWPEHVPAPKAKSGAAGRRPRTREELLGLAEDAGLPPLPNPKAPPAFDRQGKPVDPPKRSGKPERPGKPEPTPVVLPEPLQSSDPGTIEVSEDMSRGELVIACNRAGLEIPQDATKAQLLELIQTQGE